MPFGITRHLPMKKLMRSGPPRALWAAIAAVLVTLAAPAAASAQDAPSLRLVAADSHVHLAADELGESVDLGL